ncbi:MAG: HEAT repeat domain-containing protein [Vicinamibacteria bacterium]|nr:HEAT repeat domain-containing protein [Vicinamibacteria bacterium]
MLLWSVGASAQVPGDSTQAERLLQQLREFPAALPGIARSDGSRDPVEERRRAVYLQLREIGKDALPALAARGLSHPDVQIRRNVALFLSVAAGGWSDLSQPKLDIHPCLSSLIEAVADTDARVRQLAAQAIGAIGSPAAPAVPVLVKLLTDPDEGSRNSACIGLTGIGPPARDALPALRRALSDPSGDVRRFAQRAIKRIDVPQGGAA